MLATLLVVIGCAIPLLLGSVHLVYTFHGNKLWPRDDALRQRMQQVHPVITSETTLWRCWIGFNASHSMAPMLFGLLYGYLALAMPGVLFGSPFLLAIGAITLLSLVVLAKRYWFSIPLIGIALATVCYLAGVAVALLR